MKFKTFTEAQDHLTGYMACAYLGQDNSLGHIYVNPDGKEFRLIGAMGGGYELTKPIVTVS